MRAVGQDDGGGGRWCEGLKCGRTENLNFKISISIVEIVEYLSARLIALEDWSIDLVCMW